MKKLAILGLCILCVCANAGELSPRAQTITKRFNQVQTLRCAFTQEKQLSMLSAPVISHGTLTFSRMPQQIRWEYTAPFAHGFLVTGGKTYRLEKGTKTLLKQAFARTLANELLTWLTFDLQALSSRYEIDFTQTGVVLTPKTTGPLTKITVVFDTTNPQALSQIRLDEPGGDYTLLHFTDTHINPVLAEDSFQ